MTPDPSLGRVPVISSPVQPGHRRLRSRKVIIGGVAAAVITICTCGFFSSREDRRCVDTATSSVIDESSCRSGHTGARWYYGGSNSGGKMVGGSYERGGFGGFFGGGG